MRRGNRNVLLSFTECALNDLKTGDVAKEVTDGLIWVAILSRGWSCLHTGIAWMVCKHVVRTQ
jgi:hypothetical protein